MAGLKQEDRGCTFSMLEVLVVIGVVCVVLGLLLPFVGTARESARRAQCTNNMRQIGGALYNHHDIYKRLPASGTYGVAQTDAVPQPAHHHTWLMAIINLLEAAPSTIQPDEKKPIWGQPEVGLQHASYRCPADPDYSGPQQSHGIAITNYSAAEGYHWWPTAIIPDSSPWSGMAALQTNLGSFDAAGIFAPEHYTTFEDIKDGTSQTMMVAENSFRGYKNGVLHTSGTGVPREGDDEGVFRSAFVFTAWHGQIAGEGGKYSMVDGSGPHNNDWFRRKPYSFSPTYISAFGINTDWPGADSRHQGQVVNSLFADGSVRPIHESIDWPIWLLLNGKADGRKVKDDDINAGPK